MCIGVCRLMRKSCSGRSPPSFRSRERGERQIATAKRFGVSGLGGWPSSRATWRAASISLPSGFEKRFASSSTEAVRSDPRPPLRRRQGKAATDAELSVYGIKEVCKHKDRLRRLACAALSDRIRRVDQMTQTSALALAAAVRCAAVGGFSANFRDPTLFRIFLLLRYQLAWVPFVPRC